MGAYTYDPTRVIVNANGVPITGFPKDTFINFAYANDAVTMTETIHGDAVFSLQRVQSGTLTLSLMAGSNGHAIFTALAQAQRRTRKGQFALSITDVNVPDGAAVFVSPYARVVRMPDFTYGGEAPVVSWNILCTNIEHLMAAIPSDTLLL